MFGLSNGLEVIIRSFITIVALFALTKMLGRKQITQLTLFEYITGITIGSIVAEISTGVDENFIHGILSLIVWTIIPLFVSLLSLKSKRFRDFVDGTPTVVIQDGKIQEDNLKKKQYTVDDLTELLRNKSAFNIADVEFAVLETNGDLNLLLKREKQPLTPKDMQINIANQKEPKIVITEGMILEDSLWQTGYNHLWLNTELEKLNVALENVFIGQIDSYGKLTVDIYDDKIQLNKSQEKSLLLATLKKCQADLELYTLATESQSAQKMYEKNAKRIDRVIQRIKPYLMD